jgi:serine/threonine-protein kinase
VVPDLLGLTKEQAIKKLEDAGLQLGAVSPGVSTEANKGKVISQSIAKGLTIQRGQKIDVTIGKGPDTAIVPNVKGETEAQAKSDLMAAGFTSINVTHSSAGSCAFQIDVVCDQTPAAGTTQPKTTAITIVIGQEATPTESPTPPFP